MERNITKERLDQIVSNDKEWRIYMIGRIDRIDEDLNKFKIRTIGFMTVFTAIVAKLNFM